MLKKILTLLCKRKHSSLLSDPIKVCFVPLRDAERRFYPPVNESNLPNYIPHPMKENISRQQLLQKESNEYCNYNVSIINVISYKINTLMIDEPSFTVKTCSMEHI